MGDESASGINDHVTSALIHLTDSARGWRCDHRQCLQTPRHSPAAGSARGHWRRKTATGPRGARSADDVLAHSRFCGRLPGPLWAISHMSTRALVAALVPFDSTMSTSERVRRTTRSRPSLLLAAIAVAAVWALAFELPRFVGLVSSNAGANDFRLFYIAAESGLRWGWPHMYDIHYLDVLSSALGDGNDIKPAFTYANPPLVAWIAIPLTRVPLALAFYIWTSINLAAFVIAWWLVLPKAGFMRIATLLASLAVWPTIYALERGQPVLLTYALAIGAWSMVRRNRQIEAGVLLALGWAVKPQDLALLPLVFVMCGFRRAALWWLLTSSILWLIFALVLGPNGLGTYLGILAWVETSPQHLADTYAVVVGSGIALPLVEGVLLVLTLLAVWRQRRNWDIAFAIGLVGTVLAGIHVHEYDYVALVMSVWLILRQPVGAIELIWVGVGVVGVQILSVGDRLPILLWQPVWLAILALRPSPEPIYLPTAKSSPMRRESTSGAP